MTTANDSDTTSTDEATSLQLTGLHIYTGGIALQATVILAFLVLAYQFQRQVSKEATRADSHDAKRLLRFLYAILGLILVSLLCQSVEIVTDDDSSESSSVLSNSPTHRAKKLLK